MPILTLDKRSIKNLSNYHSVIGALYGYPKESLEFFGNELVPAFMKFQGTVATYEEFAKTEMCGTGYISNPQEVRDFVDGKITYQQIVKRIDSARAVITPYPIQPSGFIMKLKSDKISPEIMKQILPFLR